jgi:hypothetical protein
MEAADAQPGAAVTVQAADDFYKYVDGWHGVVIDRPGQAGAVWIVALNPENFPVELLVPPDQLESRAS